MKQHKENLEERLKSSIGIVIVLIVAMLIPGVLKIVTILCLLMAIAEIVFAWRYDGLDEDIVNFYRHADQERIKQYEKHQNRHDSYKMVPAQLIILVSAIIITIFGNIDRWQLAFVIIICLVSDACGWFFGHRYGKTKIDATKKYSPNKTAEGYIASIIGGAIVGWILLKILPIASNGKVIFFVLVCGLLACLGDLIGSGTKRELGLSNSGDSLRKTPILSKAEEWIAGQGGFLDRFDSISLVLIAFLLLH